MDAAPRVVALVVVQFCRKGKNGRRKERKERQQESKINSTFIQVTADALQPEKKQQGLFFYISETAKLSIIGTTVKATCLN